MNRKDLISSIFCFLISMGILLFNLPFGFLISILYLILALRVKPLYTYLSAVAFFISVSILYSGGAGILIAMEMVLFPVLFADAIRRDKSIEVIIIKGIIFALGASIFAHWQLKAFYDTDLQQLFLADLNIVLDNILENGPAYVDIVAQVRETLKYIDVLYPFWLFVQAVGKVIFLLLLTRVLNNLKLVNCDIEPFSKFKFRPMGLIQKIILSVGLFILAKSSEKGILLVSLILLVLEVILSLEGISLVDYFLQKKKIPSIIRHVIMALIMFVPFLQQIASISGALDVIMDFRKLEKSK